MCVCVCAPTYVHVSACANLHAEGNHGDDHLEEQGEGELPERGVETRVRRAVRQAVAHNGPRGGVRVLEGENTHTST